MKMTPSPFTDFVSIEAFGAVPGIDCTSAFQAAVQTGQPIYVPAGRAWVIGSDAIDLTCSPNPSIVIAGAGSLASVLHVHGPARSAFRYTPDVNPTQTTSFDFRDFCLTASKGGAHIGIEIAGSDEDRGTIDTVMMHGVIFANLQTGLRLRHVANLSCANVSTQKCHTGISLYKCPDSDLVNVKVQSGSGPGFLITGMISDHRSEGIRLSNCSTNAQHVGFQIDGCAFINLANCDTSDAVGGGVILRDAHSIHLSGGEFSAGPESTNAAITVDADCSMCQFTGLLFYAAAIGIDLHGARHSVVGCQGSGNRLGHIRLGATSSVVSGNNLGTSPCATAIVELPGADYNNVSGNISYGTIELIGPHSCQFGNIIG